MAYKLRYIEEDDILFTEYFPPVSLEDRVEAMGDNLTLAARTGALRLLGDCRALPVAPDVGDVYRLGAVLDQLGFDRRSHEALVVLGGPSICARDYEMFARIGSPRGVVVRLFETVEEATDWLRTCQQKAPYASGFSARSMQEQGREVTSESSQ